MAIEFTQFMLPGGRKKQTQIELPPMTEDIARELIKNGHEFQSEILTTGQVSLTIVYKHEDVMISICENNYKVGMYVVDMINAYARKEGYI